MSTSMKSRNSTLTRQVLALFEPLVNGVKDREPACLSFQVLRQKNVETGLEELFTVERYVGVLRTFNYY